MVKIITNSVERDITQELEAIHDSSDGYEGFCQHCDSFGLLDDMFFCKECAEKAERDLIRQRDWEYSALAYKKNDKEREELRKKVIKKYGKKMEILTER